MFAYTLVYSMSDTKTIRVSEDLHGTIVSHNREGETLSETLERLISSPSLRELAGTLSDEEVGEFREAIEGTHRDHTREIDSMLDRAK